MGEVVSIVILTRNATGYLDDLMKSLACQKCRFSKELVVIDSSSSDGTVERIVDLCARYGLALDISTIPAGEFGHGRTRNLAVAKARGEIIATLSQDALPVSDTWLDHITAPLEEEEVAGVFGRQTARPGTALPEALFLEQTYPRDRQRIDSQDLASFSNVSLFFSNVNGAFKKSLIMAHPFRDDLVMSEDQFWGRAIIKQGYSIVYEPRAAVLHSHDYSLAELFRRYFQSGHSMRQMGMAGRVMSGGARTMIRLLGRVLATSPRSFPYSVLFQFVKGVAFLCGRYDLLPAKLCARLLYLGPGT